MDYLKKAKEFKTKKRLGQNFLVDEKALDSIVEAVNLSADDNVLEIGGGAGFLTEKLAQKARKVTTIEIDPAAVGILNSLPCDNITVVHDDILKVNFKDLTDTPIKVAANIPYYITSPILVHLLGEIDSVDNPNRPYISEIVLMVQYEVARRMVADQTSKNKEYSSISVLTNYWCETEFLFKVPARSFYPSPKVDSAVIKLKVRKEPAVDVSNPRILRRVVQASFATRRKNIKNSLSIAGFKQDIVDKALQESNIDATRRGESLSLEEYRDLANALTRFIEEEKNEKTSG